MPFKDKFVQSLSQQRAFDELGPYVKTTNFRRTWAFKAISAPKLVETTKFQRNCAFKRTWAFKAISASVRPKFVNEIRTNWTNSERIGGLNFNSARILFEFVRSTNSERIGAFLACLALIRSEFVERTNPRRIKAKQDLSGFKFVEQKGSKRIRALHVHFNPNLSWICLIRHEFVF